MVVSMSIVLEDLRAMIHLGWIGAAGTTLRREDEKKARELVGFLREATFLIDSFARARARTRTKRELVVVDAAAGKGYVGVALARAGTGVAVTALERDASRVEAIRHACGALGVPRERVDARVADVSDSAAWPASPDVVVSLHACGDATDRVIDRSIACGARALLVAPCCVAGELPAAQRAEARAARDGLDRHGELRRRFVETYVLGERVLTLESAGYKVALVPFAAPTVTPYNVAIRATVSREPERIARTSEALARLRAR